MFKKVPGSYSVYTVCSLFCSRENWEIPASQAVLSPSQAFHSIHHPNTNIQSEAQAQQQRAPELSPWDSESERRKPPLKLALTSIYIYPMPQETQILIMHTQIHRYN